MTSDRVFYSWQSDLPNAANRGLIENAIAAATKQAAAELDIAVRPDQGTEGVTGSPNISATLFEKIKTARVFVADVTPINVGKAALKRRPSGRRSFALWEWLHQPSPGRMTPNPNVMIELGYAAHSIGWERIILVLNRAYGATAEDLPFDIRGNRCVAYDSHPKDGQRAPIRRGLVDDLRPALLDVLNSQAAAPGAYPMALTASVRFEGSPRDLYLDYHLVNRGTETLREWLVKVEIPREVVPQFVNFMPPPTATENGRLRFDLDSASGPLKNIGLRPGLTDTRGQLFQMPPDLWPAMREQSFLISAYVKGVEYNLRMTFDDLMGNYEPLRFITAP